MRLWMETSLWVASMFFLILLAAAQSIETSFEVRADCTNEQRQLLDQYVTETLELVSLALDGINDFQNDEKVRMNLVSYLGAKPTGANKNINIVINMLSDVKDFLTGAKTAFGGGPKPRLYCSSKWWKLKQPGDPAQNANGDPIPDVTVREQLQGELGVIKGKQQHAYWSDDYKRYTIGDDTDGEFYCDDEKNLGLTDTSGGMIPIALIMCPSAFDLHVGTDIERTASLGDTRPRENQILNPLQPRSMTLFHEVIHVVRGARATTRPSGDPSEWYGCPKIMEFAEKDQNGARKNPDNYAFFALSYWFWTKRTYSDDENSAQVVAEGQPGVKYNFVGCEAKKVASSG